MKIGWERYDSTMDYFLSQLAQKKYQLYMKIYKDQLPYKKDDCQQRVYDIEKYETILEIVQMLNPQESLRFSDIEKMQYPEAPYVR